MRLVSFSTNGTEELRSGIDTAARIADAEQVAALLGFGEDARMQLGSMRGLLARQPADLAQLAQTGRLARGGAARARRAT